MQYEGVTFLQGFYFACATCTTVGCVADLCRPSYHAARATHPHVSLPREHHPFGFSSRCRYGDLSPSDTLSKAFALFLLPAGTVLTAKTLGDMSGVLFRVQSIKMERAVMKQFGTGINFQDFADLKMQIGSDPATPTITKNEFLLAMIMRCVTSPVLPPRVSQCSLSESRGSRAAPPPLSCPRTSLTCSCAPYPAFAFVLFVF